MIISVVPYSSSQKFHYVIETMLKFMDSVFFIKLYNYTPSVRLRDFNQRVCELSMNFISLKV